MAEEKIALKQERSVLRRRWDKLDAILERGPALAALAGIAMPDRGRGADILRNAESIRSEPDVGRPEDSGM
jgi:hypothetical protein